MKALTLALLIVVLCGCAAQEKTPMAGIPGEQAAAIAAEDDRAAGRRNETSRRRKAPSRKRGRGWLGALKTGVDFYCDNLR